MRGNRIVKSERIDIAASKQTYDGKNRPKQTGQARIHHNRERDFEGNIRAGGKLECGKHDRRDEQQYEQLNRRESIGDYLGNFSSLLHLLFALVGRQILEARLSLGLRLRLIYIGLAEADSLRRY